jgi:sugar phosphate isomerase/epimerase
MSTIPPIACMELMFGDVGGEKLAPWLKDIKAAGFEGAALRFSTLKHYFGRAPELHALLRANGLLLAGAYAPIETDAADVENLCALLQAVQCDNLCLHGGKRGGASERTALAHLLDGRGEMARRYGVCVSFHHHTHVPFETYEETAELLALTNPAHVHLFIDTGHAEKDFVGLPLGTRGLELARRHRARLKYVEFKEWNPQSDLATELGNGKTDFRALAAYLLETNYTGWITLEQNGPTPGSTAIACAERSLKVARRAFSDAASQVLTR